MHKNPICWWEFASSDGDKTAKFLNDVFDWGLECVADSRIHETNYEGECSSGLRGGGAFTLLNPELDPHFTMYVAVDDVDEMAKKVVEAGGTIYHGPIEVPGTTTRICLIREPAAGMIIGMVNKKRTA